MKLFIAALFACGLGWGQLQCNQVPNGTACQVVNNFNGSNQLTSSCTALSASSAFPRTAIVSISAATNASPVVMTSAAHGFALGSRPKVTISGFTVNWLTANGAFTATVIDANTFSVVLDSSAFGAVTGTPVFTTTAPRTSIAEWAVRLFSYDGSGNLIGQFWLNGTMAMTSLCTSTALSTANAQ